MQKNIAKNWQRADVNDYENAYTVLSDVVVIILSASIQLRMTHYK
jgi:hypothetical protein